MNYPSLQYYQKKHITIPLLALKYDSIYEIMKISGQFPNPDSTWQRPSKSPVTQMR